MCGIIGVVSLENVVPLLLDGPGRLEYRGYDSAGLAVIADGLKQVRVCGRVRDLRDRVAKAGLHGSAGIAHTCCIPCDYVPVRSWPLFRARELMQHLIESFTPCGEATSASPIAGSRAGGVFLPPGEAHP